MWYSFTPPLPCTLVVTVHLDTLPAADLDVYASTSATPTADTLIFAGSPAHAVVGGPDGASAVVNVNVDARQTYYIRVRGDEPAALQTGAFTITVDMKGA